jgi:hypothetical protein
MKAKYYPLLIIPLAIATALVIATMPTTAISMTSFQKAYAEHSCISAVNNILQIPFHYFDGAGCAPNIEVACTFAPSADVCQTNDNYSDGGDSDNDNDNDGDDS